MRTLTASYLCQQSMVDVVNKKEMFFRREGRGRVRHVCYACDVCTVCSCYCIRVLSLSLTNACPSLSAKPKPKIRCKLADVKTIRFGPIKGG